MAEWVYKATEKKVGYLETHTIAMKDHLLCRSAVDDVGDQADRVREIQIGDRIHFYYKRKNKDASDYGTFEVVDGSAYPTRFGRQIPGTALFEVLETPENAAMLGRLTREYDQDPEKGYVRDPENKCFTGWVIERRGNAPPFNQKKMLPGPMINLWPYPDPKLVNPAPKKP